MDDKQDAELIELFKGLDTASVSDALDKKGLAGQCFGLLPVGDYSEPVAGFAFTVRYVAAGTPPGTVGDFLDDVNPGDVVVIDNGGRTDCTVWGDIMTEYAQLKGVAATVIDGVCRDVSKAISDRYPIFSKGRFMRTGKDRVQVASVNEPVSIGSARVEARDVVVCDASGVIVVPRKHAVEVAGIARRVEEAESAIRALLRSGSTLREARRELGYHLLQREAE